MAKCKTIHLSGLHDEALSIVDQISVILIRN